MITECTLEPWAFYQNQRVCKYLQINDLLSMISAELILKSVTHSHSAWLLKKCNNCGFANDFWLDDLKISNLYLKPEVRTYFRSVLYQKLLTLLIIFDLNEIKLLCLIDVEWSPQSIESWFFGELEAFCTRK